MTHRSESNHFTILVRQIELVHRFKVGIEFLGRLSAPAAISHLPLEEFHIVAMQFIHERLPVRFIGFREHFDRRSASTRSECHRN
jgi:hypothetical protein